MTDATKKQVDDFLLVPKGDLRLLVTEEEQHEILKAQRRELQSSQTLRELESL